jgi:four helix bundle protein
VGINDYRDLIVWQKSMDLVVGCYQISQSFPAVEKYGLTSQLRRAAVSIPANIAEGHGRSLTNVFNNHLSIAMGSLKELETHILIAQRLEYLNQLQTTELINQCAEIGRMIRGLSRSITEKASRSKPTS